MDSAKHQRTQRENEGVDETLPDGRERRGKG